jgi:hypothetical protein
MQSLELDEFETTLSCLVETSVAKHKGGKELDRHEEKTLSLLLERIETKKKKGLELDELERAILSRHFEISLAKLKEDKKLGWHENRTLGFLLDRVQAKKKEGLELDEHEREICSILERDLAKLKEENEPDLPEQQTLHFIFVQRIRSKYDEGLEFDELERETLSRLVESALAKLKEDKKLHWIEKRTLHLLLDMAQAKNKEGLQLDEHERETLSRLVESALAKLKEDKKLHWIEKRTLHLLLDMAQAKNKEGLQLDEHERETLSLLFDQPVLFQAFNLIIDRIEEKNIKGLMLDELERETLGRIALRILAKKREEIELTQAESKILGILRKLVKKKDCYNEFEFDQEFERRLWILRILAKDMEDEEFERQILSLPVAKIMFNSIDDVTTIKDILSKELQCKYGTNQSIVRDRRKLYIFDSKMMTEVLEYQEIDDFCLSISGNTLVVREGDRLDIWDLSAKTAQFIDDIFDVSRDVISCDDEYIAYNDEHYKLTVYHIATKQKRTLGKQYNLKLVQIFKESLYYVSDYALTVQKLNDDRTSWVTNRGVVSITANKEAVVALYTNGLVEVWKKDFEVKWRFEVDEHYDNMLVIGDKVVLTDKRNEAVIHDLKSHTTKTVITEGIGNIHKAYVEIELSKVTLSISQVFELKSSWKYWLSLVLGLLYYLDVGTDLVLLLTYFSAELYLIFALSLALIITPNIIELTTSKHKTLITSLAKLLFVEHFLALVRDYKNPTFLHGCRDTGKELSKRTAIETGIESIPQSLIALYFIISTENYTTVPLVSLAISMLSASIATSFGLKLVKSNYFVGCLMCYRFCEILLRVMILALCSTYIYPYFAILFIASSTVLYYLYLRITDKEQKIYLLASSAINALTYINGFRKVRIEFITKGDSGFSIVHLFFSSVVNIVLISILQARDEVSLIFPAFLWALLVTQLALYLLMLCDEGHRVSKEEDSLAGCFSGILESVRELGHRTSLRFYRPQNITKIL